MRTTSTDARLEPVADEVPEKADSSKTLDVLLDGREQAHALRTRAREGGLRFDAYLPSELADWLLDMIEHGVFRDPSEAVFVILGEHRDLQRTKICATSCCVDPPRRRSMIRAPAFHTKKSRRG